MEKGSIHLAYYSEPNQGKHCHFVSCYNCMCRGSLFSIVPSLH